MQLLQGTYVLLEKLRHGINRQLLKRVVAVHCCLVSEHRRSQLPLAAYHCAFKLQVMLF